MTLRKKILLGLLAPAVVMTVVQIVRPDEGLEWFCYVFVVPVAVLNMWEWTSLDASEWENLRGRYAREFHPTKWLRERWMALMAARQRRASLKGSEEESAPAGEIEAGKKKISILTIASSKWENLRERSARDFHPMKWLRERWMAFVATLPRRSAHEEGEEKSARMSEAETRNKKIRIRAIGMLGFVAGGLIMAAVFAHTGFGLGMLIAGVVGFIAFIVGLYITFG